MDRDDINRLEEGFSKFLALAREYNDGVDKERFPDFYRRFTDVYGCIYPDIFRLDCDVTSRGLALGSLKNVKDEPDEFLDISRRMMI